MSVQIIFGVTGGFILGIYALMGTFGMKGKGQLLHVPLSEQRQKSAEVVALYKVYLKAYQQLMLMLTVGLLVVTFLPLPWMALKVILYLIWILIGAVLPIRIYERHRKVLRGWVREKDREEGLVPGRQKTGGIRYADLVSAKARGGQTLGWQWFVPMIVVILALVAFDMGSDSAWHPLMTLYSSGLLIVLTSWWMSKNYGRLRNPVISTDSAVNSLYANTFKRRWSFAYWLGAVLACLCSVALGVIATVTTDESVLMNGTLILMGVAVLGEVLCLLWTAYGLQQLKDRLCGEEMQEDLADEDDFWFWGTLYNNPQDTSKYVPKRFGIGVTPNFAHKGNRLLYGGVMISALLILVLALGGALLMEIAEPGVDLSNPNTIVFKALGYGRTFEQSELLSVERVPVSSVELTYKTNGMWSSRRAIGYFRAAGYEEVLLYANLQASEFLKLEFKDITVLCTLGDEKAIDVAYDELVARLKIK